MLDARLSIDNVTRSGQSPTFSNKSSTSTQEQSRLPAPNFLQRPLSSHEDPAVGFRYEKAKPARALDFSLIKSKQQEPASIVLQGTPPSEQFQRERSDTRAIPSDQISLPQGEES